MQNILGVVRAAVVAGAIAWASTASANVISIDFPQDVVPGTMVNNGNGMAGGFVISPSAEYTLVAPGGGGGSLIASGLGFDSDGPANPNFLGPYKLSTASLYIGSTGSPFSLLSLSLISSGFDDLFEVVSSKGGVYNVPHQPGGGTIDIDFSDPAWTDIDWFLLGYFDAGVPTVGLTQMVVSSVAEPATLLLFGVGLLALCAFGRPRNGLRERSRAFS